MGLGSGCDGQGLAVQSIYGRTFGNRYLVFAVAVLVLAVLLWWLAERLDRDMNNAEHMHFEMRLAELRSAVLLMQATLVAKDDMQAAEKYVGSNPMDWMALAESDRQYLGELRLEDAMEQRGKWVFDPWRKVIAYRPLSDDWLSDVESGNIESAWLQFRVVALWSNESKRKSIKALALQPLQSYAWSAQKTRRF